MNSWVAFYFLCQWKKRYRFFDRKKTFHYKLYFKYHLIYLCLFSFKFHIKTMVKIGIDNFKKHYKKHHNIWHYFNEMFHNNMIFLCFSIERDKKIVFFRIKKMEENGCLFYSLVCLLLIILEHSFYIKSFPVCQIFLLKFQKKQIPFVRKYRLFFLLCAINRIEYLNVFFFFFRFIKAHHFFYYIIYNC